MIKVPKKLALLGLGERSTAFYLQELNRYYQQYYGNDSTCPLVLLNTDFSEFNPYLPNQFDMLEQRLSYYLHEVTALGVESVLIPNITLHETYDRLIKNTNNHIAKCIHPIELAITELQKAQHTNIVLFASAYSM